MLLSGYWFQQDRAYRQTLRHISSHWNGVFQFWSSPLGEQPEWYISTSFSQCVPRDEGAEIPTDSADFVSWRSHTSYSEDVVPPEYEDHTTMILEKRPSKGIFREGPTAPPLWNCESGWLLITKVIVLSKLTILWTSCWLSKSCQMKQLTQLALTGNITSVAVLAEISLSSPRKLFIFINKK